MRIVPKANVRANLALAILLTIVLSWVLSSGIANYFNYLNIRSLRWEMMKHPDVYSRPIPEPTFGIVEFLTGRPPFAMEPRRQPPPVQERLSGRRPMGPPGGHPPGPYPASPQLMPLLLRLAVALGLAGIAALCLGRKLTKPLTHLAEGAEAFQAGDFAYRIPSGGQNEFSAVADAMNEMARRVSDQIGRLENDAERRRQFLADIAHEFRSPVATMRTMAGALQDGVAEEPERRDRAISALVGTSERLLRLVQDLMELAKLDLDEFPLNVRVVNLRELVESTIQSHEAEAGSAGITLLQLDPGQSIEAQADPDRIAQVLDNVLENAISYSGAGSHVQILLRDDDPVKIEVHDSGKGIRATDVPYVLDPFYRADQARTPGDSHSGLGLSIASRLVEAHGGTLTVSSEEGKGTTVTILLPKGL